MEYPEDQRPRQPRQPRKILALMIAGAGLLILGVSAILLIPTPAESSTQDFPSAIPVEVSFPAPEISLATLDGVPISLADLQGQIVLVNNWATWCPPCKAEMPDLNRYYTDHKGKGFTLIGIEAGSTQAEVTQVVEDFDLKYPIWLDPDEDALYAFRTNYLPSSFLVDRAGTVRLAWSGAISLKNLEKYVTPLLEE